MSDEIQKGLVLRKKQWTAVVLLLVVVITALNVWWMVSLSEEELRSELLLQARLVKQTVNFDRLLSLSGTAADIGTPDYLRIKEQLSNAKKANEKCRFIYIMGRRADGKIFFYVDNEPVGGSDEAAAGDIYEEISQEYLSAFDTETELTVGPVTDRWGKWITSLIPISDPGTGDLIAVMGMDIDAHTWTWDVFGKSVLLVGLVLVIGLLGFIFALLWQTNQRMKIHQEALIKSESFSQSLSEALPDYVFVLDEEGIIQRINRVHASDRMEDIIGLRAASFVVEGDRQLFEDALRETVRSGQTQTLETLVDLPDGRHFFFNRMAPVSLAEAENCVVLVSIDITERKRFENETARLTSILNATSDLVSMSNIDKSIVYFNAAGKKMVGWSEDEDLKGRIIPDVHPRWAIEIIENEGIPGAINDGIWKGETALLGPDGLEIPVSQVIISHKNAAGQVEFLSTIIRDIAEQKQAEDRFRRFCEVTYEGLLFHEEGLIVDVNNALVVMLGYSKDTELIGKQLMEFVAPESHEAVIEQLRSGDTVPYEIVVLRKDGSSFPVEAEAQKYEFRGHSIRVASIRDITERKQAEQALRESDKLYRQAIASADAIAYKRDFTSESFSFISEGIFKLTGYHPEELSGDIWQSLVQETVMRGKCADLTSEEAISLTRQGKLKEWQADFRIINRDGEERWLADSSVHLEDEKGKVIGSLGILQDITDRKRAELALNESEARYRTLVVNAPEAIVVLDMDAGKIVDVNENAEELFGLSREEIANRNPDELSPHEQPDGRPSIEAAAKYVRLAYEGSPQVFEWNHLNFVAGKEIPCEVRLVCLPSSKQKLVRGSVVDITERKQAEEELRHLRNYLSNIIDSMPSVLVGVDASGKVTQWNKKAEQATGIVAADALGKTLSDVFPRMATETERIAESIRTSEIKHEQKQPRQIGDEICIEDVTIYPLAANGVEGAVIRIDDVTEQVRMEEMLIQNEKMLSVGGLAAGMAHEINNPLAGMMQTANVLASRLGKRMDIAANRKAAEAAGTTMEAIQKFMKARDILRMISTINESGRRAAEIVDNMLSFARKSEAQVSSHDIADLLEKTLVLAATDYNLKKHYDFKLVKIRKEYEEGLPLVPCEAAKIQQVLLNILRNGAEAMQEAGTDSPCFVLRTMFEKERKMICIEIEDNGPGMTETIRKRVFEPFYTTKPVGMGTGLGLSVSYFIITENHHGEMAVESRPGAGAKFIVRLPKDKD